MNLVEAIAEFLVISMTLESTAYSLTCFIKPYHLPTVFSRQLNCQRASATTDIQFFQNVSYSTLQYVLLDEKKVFLGLNSLSNRLSTFQTLYLAGHARILITGENEYLLNSAQLQKGKINSFKRTVKVKATEKVLSRSRVLAQWDVD